MASHDENERRLSALERDHAMTRWWTGRLDRDIAEIGATQAEHTHRLDRIETTLQEHTTILQEHTGRFDSLDAQMRSLTQLVGQVLDRLTGPDDGAGDTDGNGR